MAASGAALAFPLPIAYHPSRRYRIHGINRVATGLARSTRRKARYPERRIDTGAGCALRHVCFPAV